MLVAMHAPDGFLGPGVAVVTAVISIVVIGLALRHASAELDDRQVPLAGISAAFIFAAQMFNFPVAAGTTGHLLGGALAAILLGPWVGALVVAVVVVVQALLFADGGITALGYNVLNMAIVPAFAGWALFLLWRKVMPRSSGGVVGAAGLACGMTVVLSATAFSIEWLFGATAPIPFDTVFGAMVGVHALIGIGEGLLSALVVGAVMAARPDLVAGARSAPAPSPSAECWWQSCSPWWSASSPSTTPTASNGWLRTTASSTEPRTTRSRAAPSPTTPPAASATLS